MITFIKFQESLQPIKGIHYNIRWMINKILGDLILLRLFFDAIKFPDDVSGYANVYHGWFNADKNKFNILFNKLLIPVLGTSKVETVKYAIGPYRGTLSERIIKNFKWSKTMVTEILPQLIRENDDGELIISRYYLYKKTPAIEKVIEEMESEEAVRKIDI